MITNSAARHTANRVSRSKQPTTSDLLRAQLSLSPIVTCDKSALRCSQRESKRG